MFSFALIKFKSNATSPPWAPQPIPSAQVTCTNHTGSHLSSLSVKTSSRCPYTPAAVALPEFARHPHPFPDLRRRPIGGRSFTFFFLLFLTADVVAERRHFRRIRRSETICLWKSRHFYILLLLKKQKLK